jgi:hypothetical protein
LGWTCRSRKRTDHRQGYGGSTLIAAADRQVLERPALSLCGQSSCWRRFVVGFKREKTLNREAEVELARLTRHFPRLRRLFLYNAT